MQNIIAIIVVICGFILVAALVSVRYLIMWSKKSQKWVPELPQCPDFWELSPTGKCVNSMDLGTCQPSPSSGDTHATIDFTSSSAYATRCDKFKWATNCGVSWDGITYGVENPCNAAAPSPS